MTTPAWLSRIRSSMRGYPRTWFAVGLVVTLVVLFLRRPDAFYRPQFWAEDFMFLMGAEQDGIRSLALPQAGYLHTIPRVVALLAARVDPFLQPGVFEAGWLAAYIAVIFAVTSPRLNLPLKPLLVLAFLLVPHTGEVFFNPTNAQWIAALGLLLTTLKDDPRTVGEWTVDLSFVVLSGLSGPFSIFTMPIVLYRAWNRRTRASVVLASAMAIVATVQFWFVLHDHSATDFSGPFRLSGLIGTLSYRLFANVFFGSIMPATVNPVVFDVAALAIALLLFVVGRNSPHRAVMSWLALFGVLVVATAAYRVRLDLWGYNDSGDRYFIITKVVILWITVMAFAGTSVPWRKWALGLLLACGLVSNLPHFRFAPYADFHWYALCPDIRAGKTLEITVNPGWKFRYARGHPEQFGRL